MQSSLRGKFDEAVALARSGHQTEASVILYDLSLKDPKSVAIRLTLGDVYRSMGRMNDAVEAFRSAVSLRPFHERVSISLFHCLLDAGFQREALEEAHRYLGYRDSAEYREMLEALTRK